MRHRYADVDCDHSIAQALGQAVHAYVNAAYPQGGSECAQVARTTLLDTAEQCFAHRAGVLRLRRRQLSQLRAATRWWFSENAAEDVESRRALERLLARRHKST